MPDSKSPGGSSRALHYLTGTLTSIAVSGTNTYVPLYLRSLGASYVLSGLPIVFRGIGRFAFDFASLYVMGRVRPQPVLLLGVAIAALALLASGLFPEAYAVISAYFFVGVGLAMLHIALRQIVFEGATEGHRGRAMGLLSVFIGAGPMVGIAVGGLIAGYLGYSSLFLASGGLILWLPLLFGARARSETVLAKEAGTRSPLRFRVIGEILGRSGAPLLCACSFFSLFYQSVRGLGLAFYSTDVIGLSVASYGLMRSISQLGNVSGRYFGGAWTDKSGIGSCLAGGFLVSTLGYVMVSWSDGFWSLLLVHTTIGVGAGMVSVSSQVGIMSIVPSQLRGQAIGLYRAVGDMGLLVGPVLITGSLERFGFTGSFVWMAAVPLFFSALVLSSRRRLGDRMR